MRLRYDAEVDALYIGLRDGRPSKVVPVSEYVNCDIDESGALLGIEVLFASKAVEDLQALLNSPGDAVLVQRG